METTLVRSSNVVVNKLVNGVIITVYNKRIRSLFGVSFL